MSNEKTEEIELDLDDKTLAGIALYAHERNITINEAVCQMLDEYIFINHAIDGKSNITKKSKKTGTKAGSHKKNKAG